MERPLTRCELLLASAAFRGPLSATTGITVSFSTNSPPSSMAPANMSIFLVIVTPLPLNRFTLASSRFAMLASTLSVRPTSLITCSTNNCSMNRASFSGASSQLISGTIPHSSVRTSNVCWCVGSRSVVTRPASYSGDFRMRASCPRISLGNAQTSSAVSTPLVATSVSSQRVMVAKAPIGTLSRTGAVPMVVVLRTTTTS